MLLRHAASYSLGKGVPGLLSLLALVVYTRLLPPEEYGKYTVTIATTTVTALLLFQWQRRVVARWLPAEPSSSGRLLGVAATEFMVLSGITLLIGLSFGALAPPDFPKELILLGTLFLILNSWLELNLTIAAALLQPTRYGLMLGVKSVLALAIGAALVVLGWGASGVLLGLIAGCVVGPSLFARRYWTGVRPLRPVQGEMGAQLRYGLPIAATLGLTWVVDSSDRLMLGMLNGMDAAGQYAAGYDLANFSLVALLMIVQLPIQSITLKALEQSGDSAARAALAQGAELIFGLAIAGGVGLVVLTIPIADVVIGAAFRDSAKLVLPVIAIGAVLGSLKTFYFDMPFVIGKSSAGMMVSSGVAAVLNLILNISLIPRFGILGAAWSTVVAFAVGLVMAAILGKKYFTMPPPGRAFLKAVIVGCVVAVAVYPVRWSGWTPPTQLVVGLVLGTLAAIAAFLALDLAGSGRAMRTVLQNRSRR